MGNFYHSSYMHAKSVKRGDDRDREFDTAEYEDRSTHSYDDRSLESSVDGEPWKFVGCPFDTAAYENQRNLHTDAIVIQVNGVCHNNGRPGAFGAIRIFFHRDNHEYN